MMYRFPFALLAAFTLSIISSAADAKVVITIDKSAQEMTVTVDGDTRWRWPVSTGRRGYSTPSGSYTAFRMEEDHYSKEWDDAPMPHSIFFTKRGHAIHGTNETRRLGTAASHGCVRLAPENAARLFALVKAEGVTNATVILTGSESSPGVARTAPRRATPSQEAQATDYNNYRRPPGFGQGYGYAPSPRVSDPRYGSQPYQQRDSGGFFRW
jgi:hypothetical protein